MPAAVVRFLCLAAVLAPAFAPTAAAQGAAAGRAFDCAKAQGEVQQLVCKDQGLAALDRKLDGVYKAALAKARDGMAATLRAEQRGWVKGRDECWKCRNGDPTWITASWTVSSVRDCTEASYRVRISELQATWGLVAAAGPTAFACQHNPANEVVATFFETDPKTVRLERGDRSVVAWLVPAAGGAKYEGQNVTFATKGKEASVTWLDETLACESK